jgi:hypothetical protein
MTQPVTSRVPYITPRRSATLASSFMSSLAYGGDLHLAFTTAAHDRASGPGASSAWGMEQIRHTANQAVGRVRGGHGTVVVISESPEVVTSGADRHAQSPRAIWYRLTLPAKRGYFRAVGSG